MDFRSQGVVVNAVGFLYASVGFFLSVLGAILNAFYRHNAPPLTATKNSHRKGRLDPSLPRRNRPPCTEAEPALQPQSIVPDITLDQHLDHQSTNATTTTTTFLLISSSQSTIDHGSTQRPSGEPSSNDIQRLIDVDGSRVGFRMSNLKPPWVKEKPRISRSRSSPQLSDQLSPPSSRQKNSKVKKDKREPERLEEKPEKTLRKVCSTPGPGGQITMKAFTQNAVKKRTETLRTQPYEAPYFCAPPIPLVKPLGKDVKPISKSRSMTFAV